MGLFPLHYIMKKCILIYDDDQEMLFLCKEILQGDKYHVETLTRCIHVIADIDLYKPDIILMDLWISEAGGEKAIITIKENPATQHIPVLIFSANVEVREICKRIHANGYIEKPFDIAALRQTIADNIL